MQLATALLAFKDFMLPCLNKKLFGIDCPGCGFQRALVMLFKGDYGGAYHMYPAIYGILVLAFFLFMGIFVKTKYDNYIKIFLLLANAAIIMGSYILKMNNLIH
tara:strand:+ start:974 stop:1285 length:312 start_codon:yes stop_codon:yes gene_type:complete